AHSWVRWRCSAWKKRFRSSSVRPPRRWAQKRPYAWRSTGRSCLARFSCSLFSLRAAASMECCGERSVPDAILEVEQLTKRFGGVIASDGVSLSIPKGELHAVIGPNGAGKTTLIGQLTGEIACDTGSIRFEQRAITGLPAWQRSQLGLARSFQVTSLFSDFTALDNVALAVQAHVGHSFRFWKNARK